MEPVEKWERRRKVTANFKERICIVKKIPRLVEARAYPRAAT